MSTDTTEDTHLIVSISQVLNGDYHCHCGADAVLYVTSEPDGEPGFTCYQHAMDWTNVALGLTRTLFGPKVT